jgi:nucleoid-associated protein YgaU/two-component SAPR family response regulator
MRRTSRLAAGVAALAAAVILIVGVPGGLIRYVGWPLPTRLPSLEEIQLALRSGVDPRLFINTLAIVVWVAWAQLVVAFTVETIAAVRGLAASPAPVLSTIQTSAARLVATIALAAATLTPIRPDAAIALPVSAVTVTAQDSIPATEPAEPRQAESRVDPMRGEPAGRIYEVGRFDTLWSIADTTLGDGRRWTEIRDLNLGQSTSTGGTITAATEHVPAGTRLHLPADAIRLSSDQDPLADEVTVEEGDSFWTIAEQVLTRAWDRQPDPDEITGYWRTLVDFNRDRLQPPYDPDLIYPGQVFHLPPVPKLQQPSTVPLDAPSEVGEVTVEEDDSFWTIAEQELTRAWGRQPDPDEIAGYWRTLVDVNRDRLSPPYDPNLIYPGQVFSLLDTPEDPAASHQPDSSPAQTQSLEVDPPTSDDPQQPDGIRPSPAEPQTDDVETVEPESAGEVAVAPTPAEEATQPPDTIPPSDEESDVDDTSTSLLPTAARLAGLGLLAAGVVALIDRLRRRQLRQRRPDTAPTPPPETARETEATLRAAAAPTAAQLVDLALRSLAHQIADTHTPHPDVVGVHLTDDILRVLFWHPQHDPPAGWQVDDDGHSWTLSTSVDATHLHLLADTIPAPYPALVTVGHDPGGQLLLNLEHAGAVQITGEPDQVSAVCQTMVTELAASEIADIADLVCVGFGHDLEHLERVTTVDHVDEVLPSVDERIRATSGQDDASPLHARLGPGGDAWTPLIVFDPSPDKPENADRLLFVAHQGRAVSAVVGYPTGGQWRLHIADGAVRVQPLGRAYTRRDLTPPERDAISDLTRTAMDTNGVPHALADQPPTEPDGQRRSVGDVSGDRVVRVQESRSGDPGPEVKTLGHVGVEGMSERFPESKCLELVVYLALHRRGTEADTLIEALYPGRPPNPSRLHDVVYKARRCLGDDPDGNPYLLYVDRGLYNVSAQLGCDLERLTRHVEMAEQTDQTEAVHHLQAALEQVEGTPFSGVKRGYGWAHAEGLTTHAVVTVDNAAHRLTRLALESGQPDLATWAARKGLTVSWACEQCYRNLMRAAIHTDDQLALDAIWNELNAIVDDDPGPDATDWLEAETIDLYESHRPRRRRTG